MSHFLEYAVRGFPSAACSRCWPSAWSSPTRRLASSTWRSRRRRTCRQPCSTCSRFTHQWALVPAGFVAIVIVGPLLGYVLDRVLYRHLRTATPLAKLVTSLGLLVAIPEIAKLALGFGNEPQYSPPPLWPVAPHRRLLRSRRHVHPLDAARWSRSSSRSWWSAASRGCSDDRPRAADAGRRSRAPA